MKVKMSFNWRDASASRFNQDRVRREATPYRAKKLSVFVPKQTDASAQEMQQWLKDNEVKDYEMHGIFIQHPDKVYYAGLSFNFKSDDEYILFRLTFN